MILPSLSIKTRQYAKRQATWARTRMTSWKKIKPTKIDDYIKKLNVDSPIDAKRNLSINTATV